MINFYVHKVYEYLFSFLSDEIKISRQESQSVNGEGKQLQCENMREENECPPV